jgi:hypothetical protein
MPFLYRTAIILQRRQPYVDWANALPGGDESPPFPSALAEKKEIYLGPHSETEQTLPQALAAVWDAIFEEELNAWSTDERQWPEFTREMFDDWFATELAGSIVDLVPEEPLTEDDIEDLDAEDAVRHCAWCDAELGLEQGRDVRFEVSDSVLFEERENRVLALAIERDRAAIGIVRRAQKGPDQDDDLDGEVGGDDSSEAEAEAPLEVVFRACSRPCEKRLLKEVPSALRELEQALAKMIDDRPAN